MKDDLDKLKVKEKLNIKEIDIDKMSDNTENTKQSEEFKQISEFLNEFYNNLEVEEDGEPPVQFMCITVDKRSKDGQFIGKLTMDGLSLFTYALAKAIVARPIVRVILQAAIDKADLMKMQHDNA